MNLQDEPMQGSEFTTMTHDEEIIKTMRLYPNLGQNTTMPL